MLTINSSLSERPYRGLNVLSPVSSVCNATADYAGGVPAGCSQAATIAYHGASIRLASVFPVHPAHTG